MSAARRGKRNRSAGKQREREWAEHLRKEGWEVAFVPRINGEQHYDILAAKGGDVVLWEIKSTKAGPFSDFGPAKRQASIQAALRAGGSPALCWWPFDRQGWRIFPLEVWPDA